MCYDIEHWMLLDCAPPIFITAASILLHNQIMFLHLSYCSAIVAYLLWQMCSTFSWPSPSTTRATCHQTKACLLKSLTSNTKTNLLFKGSCSNNLNSWFVQGCLKWDMGHYQFPLCNSTTSLLDVLGNVIISDATLSLCEHRKLMML